MKRNPHPDLVREHLKRWRARLLRALTRVHELEVALARAEKKRADEKRASETATRRARRQRANASVERMRAIIGDDLG